MKKCIFAFAAVFLAFAMSSCGPVAYGPSGGIPDAGDVQSVQPVVDSQEVITFMCKGYFLPNTPAPRPAMSWGAPGTIVITDKTLYFLYWNPRAKVFDVLRKLPLAGIVHIKQLSTIWDAGDYLSIEDTNRRFDLLTRWEIPAPGDLAGKNRELLNILDAARNAE